jgi:hypothetical protein
MVGKDEASHRASEYGKLLIAYFEQSAICRARLTEERKQWRKDHPFVSTATIFRSNPADALVRVIRDFTLDRRRKQMDR